MALLQSLTSFLFLFFGRHLHQCHWFGQSWELASKIVELFGLLASLIRCRHESEKIFLFGFHVKKTINPNKIWDRARGFRPRHFGSTIRAEKNKRTCKHPLCHFCLGAATNNKLERRNNYSLSLSLHSREWQPQLGEGGFWGVRWTNGHGQKSYILMRRLSLSGWSREHYKNLIESQLLYN